MKAIYAGLLFTVSTLWGLKAQAQYAFTDANLASYTQDFNSLTGVVLMTTNQVSTLPEVYAEANFSGFPFQQVSFGPNDGSSPNSRYYHFGYADGAGSGERAFGGIGGFLPNSTTPGVGYVGIRFKNNSTKTIVNLEVGYAMEQWYNSTFATSAQVSVSYQVNTSVTSLIAGTWTTVPELLASAPSTATLIGARDGNEASNRRVMNTTINNINIPAGQEVMIRWAYVLNSNTNGNGLSIDDVVVTPQTNIFYSKQTGNLDAVGTWGTSIDGTGTPPANFTAPNQTFYVQSPDVTSTTSRISASTWTVNGLNSKIVVGTATSPAILAIANTKTIFGTVDVGNGSVLYRNQPNTLNPTLGRLANSSTVEYITSGSVIDIPGNQYGNLKISGSNTNRSLNAKQLAGNIVVSGTLTIASGSNLVLRDYDPTVLSSGSIAPGSTTAYVVTDGLGQLRVQVPRASVSAAGAVVAFPVGSSFTSYTPAALQQTSTNSDDIFEVRVVEGVFKTYAPNTYAGTMPVGTKVVNKTWLISKEVPANPTVVNLTLQWRTGETTADFVNSEAHINHYTNGNWDVYSGEKGTSTVAANTFAVTRTGITSFSPFSVSSQLNGALPVELVTFEAKAQGGNAQLSWSTASEKNNDYFSVERSFTGEVFEAIGQVAGHGSSSQAHSYALTDAGVGARATGVVYYRLRQADADGTSSFGPVRALKLTATPELPRLGLYPNPATTTTMLDLTTLPAGPYQVTVVDGIGRTRSTGTYAGGAAHSLALQQAQPGTYLVLVRGQGVKLTKTLVKE